MTDVDTLPAPELESVPATTASWESERNAFLRLLPSLISAHGGLYVAVYQGAVIADGPEQVEVAKRAYLHAGYVPLYVGLVTEEQQCRLVRIHSPRRLADGTR